MVRAVATEPRGAQGMKQSQEKSQEAAQARAATSTGKMQPPLSQLQDHSRSPFLKILQSVLEVL